MTTAARRVRKDGQLTMTHAVLPSGLYSADLAVQRQAVHADVPSHPSPAPATLSAHGASWATTPHAPSAVRRGPRCASSTQWWIRVCVPAILPWAGAFILDRLGGRIAKADRSGADGATDDAWNGPTTSRIHAWTIYATYALPYAPAEW